MKDYIERSEANRILRKIAEPGYHKGSFTGPVGAAMWEIDHLPAAPVREVVTCGECKYWKACGNGCQGWCESTGMFSNICEGQITMMNWFCADGERADTEAKNPKID